MLLSINDAKWGIKTTYTHEHHYLSANYIPTAVHEWNKIIITIITDIQHQSTSTYPHINILEHDHHHASDIQIPELQNSTQLAMWRTFGYTKKRKKLI